MKYPDDSLKLMSLNSNLPLAEKIAETVKTNLSKCSVRQFSDGEIQINIEESIRGDNVYIIQSTSNPVNDHLWELLIMIDALKRASARTINLVIPYFGYARQDRTAKPREPITAKLVANMLVKAGATRVVTLDLHAVQLQGFFDIPVDNLFTSPLLAKYYLDKGFCGDDYVVVSPKNSGIRRAREMSEYLDTTLAIVDARSREGKGECDMVIGDVRNKKCILIDDMINTGTTLKTAAETLKADGADAIYVGASHGLFSADAYDVLGTAPIKEICVTDSIAHDRSQMPDYIKVITCGELLGEAVKKIHEDKSVSTLFRL